MVPRSLISKTIILNSLLALFFTLQSGVAFSESNRTDLDLDDDGLIEINDLADLNEIRNNLDGASLYGDSTGCPPPGCSGFELAHDLDFDIDGSGATHQDDAYWSGFRWQLIGSPDNPFTAVFKGNNHSISNVYIESVSRVEHSYSVLFGGLEDAEVDGANISAIWISENAAVVTVGVDGASVLSGRGETSQGLVDCTSTGVTLINPTAVMQNCVDTNSGVVELGGLVSEGAPGVGVITVDESGGEVVGGEGTDGVIDVSLNDPTVITVEHPELDPPIIDNEIPPLGPADNNYIASLSTYFYQLGVPSDEIFTGSAQAYSDAGEVTVGSLVAHFFTDDPYTLSYSWSSPTLISMNGYSDSSFTFDPSGLEGTYKVGLVVSHSSGGEASFSMLIRIEDSVPRFRNDEDTDGDGISDIVESVTDLDKDRIPDYLDKEGPDNLLPASITGADMQSTEGVSLALGDSAYTAGQNISGITLEDIDRFYGEGLATQNNYQFLHGIFDYIVNGIEPAESTQVTIPLAAATLADARYVKYRQGVGWVNFIEDEKNSIESAMGVSGRCPKPGSDDYKPGINEGHYCLQLTLQDGGPNDADEIANGTVVDTGAIATLGVTEPIITIKSEMLEAAIFEGEGERVVLALVLESDSADALLKGFTLKAEGELNEVKDIEAVRLYCDENSNGIPEASELIVSSQFTSDNGTLNFVLDHSYQLPIDETFWFVTYEF